MPERDELPRLLPVKLRMLGERLPPRPLPGDPPVKPDLPEPEPPEKLRTLGLELPDRPPSADEEKPRMLGADPREMVEPREEFDGPAEKPRLPPEKLRLPPEKL